MTDWEEPKAELVKLSQKPKYTLEDGQYFAPDAPPQSVATSNTGITAVNPSRTFTSYDRDSGEDSFLQIAEKIKKGDALVVRQEINMENFTRSITFEVQVFT